MSRRLMFLSFALLFSLACVAGQAASPWPQPPAHLQISEPTAVARLQANYRLAVAETSPLHPFDLRVSDQEATALVAEVLRLRADIPFANVRIWFRDGYIYAGGDFTGLQGTRLPILLVAAVEQTAAGTAGIVVVEAHLGSVAVPKTLTETITQTANEALAELQLAIDITDIQVQEGELRLLGRPPATPRALSPLP